MATQVGETPQRPLPGAFFNTPAVPGGRQAVARRPPSFRLPSTSLEASASAPRPGVLASTTTATSDPNQRAARMLNQNLNMEMRFPALDDYVTRQYCSLPTSNCNKALIFDLEGVSSEYDVPSSPAWNPFHRVKSFEIPDRIFEQVNHTTMNTVMGLFAELQHAWITVDNALYIWDYTHPNPELIGFEDQPAAIQWVTLFKPRAGVFVKDVTHLLAVATLNEVILLGVSGGAGQPLTLYQTGMHVPIRGIQTQAMTGSRTNGRLFLGDRLTNDIYEITYQQEEKWFSSKCAKINHTAKDVMAAIGAQSFISKVSSFIVVPSGPAEYVYQMELDDTRDLLYTLSSHSTIRVFQLKEGNVLNLLITKSLNDIMTNNVNHMAPRNPLFGPNVRIVSISPIPRTESLRLNLVAMTSTGVRLYFSATSNYYNDANSAPSSMQVQHIRFPPPSSGATSTQQSSQSNSFGATSIVNTDSKALTPTRAGRRFPPGYSFNFCERDQSVETLFVATPDSGRLARPPDTAGPGSRFMEFGQWIVLGTKAEDMGVVQKAFTATSTPSGFGNEMAVQFDQPCPEIAILSSSSVQIFRRKRLIDIFAATLREGPTEDDYENAVKKFVRLYGRTEMCASAIAVACGQAIDHGTNAKIDDTTDRNVIEYARRAFIDHGGKPDLADVVDSSGPHLDNVRPSSRAEGLALYVSRLVRSTWTQMVIRQEAVASGGITIKSTVPTPKLDEVARALAQLRKVLTDNRAFIKGLSGPEELSRTALVNEQIAMQAEHRILGALMTTISNTVEGIAFLIQLFEQPVDEIFASLPEASRDRFKTLRYEQLFTTPEGKELAKELVKAIVNRSIAAGSNVDSVADALRRRCGSFCSADDVIIFKAQEHLQKATEAGAETAAGRNMLNESLKLFERVAGSLPTEYLQAAVDQYMTMSFFAGAIQLALTVAQQRDRANRALAWIRDGRPRPDDRESIYNKRGACYLQVWRVIEAVDTASATPVPTEAAAATVARRREEAYSVVDQSDDEVFQTSLYDWYLQKGWQDRLLHLTNPFVIAYLRRRADGELEAANLLWRYFSHHHENFEAAKVQLQLAKSAFPIGLEDRIEYLSRARANAGTRAATFGRFNSSKQETIQEINDILECANVQLDILRRLENDPRLAPTTRKEVVGRVNGQIQALSDVSAVSMLRFLCG
jgi:nuclear pore complex protein Nup155